MEKDGWFFATQIHKTCGRRCMRNIYFLVEINSLPAAEVASKATPTVWDEFMKNQPWKNRIQICIQLNLCLIGKRLCQERKQLISLSPDGSEGVLRGLCQRIVGGDVDK